MRNYRPLTPAEKARKSVVQKLWRLKNKERLTEKRRERAPILKDIRLRHRYGISMIDFKLMIQDQHGLCKICKKKFTGLPHVDHDHSTGVIRGILCELCNKGLGQFKDSAEIVQAAANYLKAALRARGPEPLKQASTRAQGSLKTAPIP